MVPLAVQETAPPAHQIGSGAKEFAANARINLSSSATRTDASVLVQSVMVSALLAPPVNILTKKPKLVKLVAARPQTAPLATCTLVNVTAVIINTV